MQGYILLKNEKIVPKLASRATFALLNPYISFKFLTSLRSYNFFRNFRIVTSTIIGTCRHEVKLYRNQWNKTEKKRLNTN